MTATASFIESGILLNSFDDVDLKLHCFEPNDFQVFGDVYEFFLDYCQVYQKFPSNEILFDKFPELDDNAVGGDLNYFVATFNDQILLRKSTKIIQDEGKQLTKKPRETISNIIARLEKINQSYDEDVYMYDSEKTNNSRLDSFLARKKIVQDGRTKLLGYPTPIYQINQLGIGILPGEICSMVARPGIGKSWFAIASASINAANGYKTMFISAEMPTEQVSLRFDVFMGRMRGYEFSHQALKLGSDDIDINEYQEFLEKNSDGNLIVIDHIKDSGLNIKSIAGIIRQHRPKILVIDNMELVQPDSHTRSTWEKMNEIYYGLKQIAVSNEVCVFVTHQANREASDPYKPPTRNEVASGDALLKASDMVFSMCLSKNSEKERVIAYQKMRDMPDVPDYVYMNFDVDIGIFEQKLDNDI